MSICNSELNFYLDLLILEAATSDDKMTKKAGVGSDIVSAVKNYFGSKVNPDDKTGSFLNLIAPGVIYTTLSALGFRKIGITLGLLTTIFGIDVKSILSSIWQKFKNILGSKESITPSEVDSVVSSSIKEHDTPATEDDLARLPKEHLSKFQMLEQTRMIKMAAIIYEQDFLLHKEGWSFKDLLPNFIAKKSAGNSWLTTVLGTIFKVALSSIGLMVAGAGIKKVYEAFSGNKKEKSSMPEHVSTQTKFKVNSSYSDIKHGANENWRESISNDNASIANMLLRYAKEVYSGLDGLDSIITSTPGFQAVVNDISWYNHRSKDFEVVFIPKNFSSKKQIVDFFIDDVAPKASIK